jgi:acyl-coenzyme A thioesterase PaaI-like protein
MQPLKRDPRIEADLAERMAATDFYRWSGITLEAASEGEVELSLDARANHMNVRGVLHGGMIATLADTATGLAVRAGRQMAYAEAHILDGEDCLLARAQSSLAIIAGDPQAGGE